MSAPPPAGAQSKGAVRRFLSWRFVLLGIACLSVVFATAVFSYPIEVRRAWSLGQQYDKATYAQIREAIAADTTHLAGKRLYDFIRELNLEAIPWDDANVQNFTGSLRMYHFRGFRLYVHVAVPDEYVRDEERILLEKGSPEEKRQARDLIRISRQPSLLIDGINGRDERLRRFWAEVNEEIRRINEKMHSRQEEGLNRQSGSQ